AADELSSGRRHVDTGDELVDATLDPPGGEGRRARVAAVVRIAGRQRRSTDEERGQVAHMPTLAGDAVNVAPVGPGDGIPNGSRSTWTTSLVRLGQFLQRITMRECRPVPEDYVNARPGPRTK